MSVEQWDLTPKVSPYVDAHMLFGLLEFTDSLVDSGVLSYSKQAVAKVRLGLLRPTNMVDYAIDVYQSLHGAGAAVPDEMIQQKERVVREREDLLKSCEELDKLCKDKEQRVS
jgi:translation initiation factor 3 subunit E